MAELKQGLGALLWYCILVVIAYFLAGYVIEPYKNLIFIAVFLLTLIIWYETFRKAMRRSIGGSINSLLVFIIPSIGLSVLSKWAGLNYGFKWVSTDLIYEIFHGPFLYGVPRIDFISYPILGILFPSLIISFIYLVVLIMHFRQLVIVDSGDYIVR